MRGGAFVNRELVLLHRYGVFGGLWPDVAFLQHMRNLVGDGLLRLHDAQIEIQRRLVHGDARVAKLPLQPVRDVVELWHGLLITDLDRLLVTVGSNHYRAWADVVSSVRVNDLDIEVSEK